MEWNLLVIGLIALLGAFVLGTLLLKPLGLMLKLAFYAVTGVVLLAVCNLILGFLNLHLAVNFFTILVAGVLQLPGIIMLLIINQWFI